METQNLPLWTKSSYSGIKGCVELARETTFLMRDSKNPDGPVLKFTPAEWKAFLKGAKDGEFDDLSEG